MSGCPGPQAPEPEDACVAHTPLALLPLLPQVPVIGRVAVRDVFDRRVPTDDPGGGPGDVERGMVQASFFDVSAQTSTPAAVIEFDEVDGSRGSCVGRISRSLVSGERRGLDVRELRVEGTSRGALEVGSTAPGVYVYSGAPLLDPSGLGRLAIRVSGEGGGFPSFEGEVGAVERVNLIGSIDDLELAAADLTLAWRQGSGDMIQIAISPVLAAGASTSGGQVLCQVPDDGCYVVPQAAAEFALASGATHFDLSIERQRSQGIFLEDGVYVGLEAASELKATLVREGYGP